MVNGSESNRHKVSCCAARCRGVCVVSSRSSCGGWHSPHSQQETTWQWLRHGSTMPETHGAVLMTNIRVITHHLITSLVRRLNGWLLSVAQHSNHGQCRLNEAARYQSVIDFSVTLRCISADRRCVYCCRRPAVKVKRLQIATRVISQMWRHVS